MFHCPRCSLSLRRSQRSAGIVFECPDCRGCCLALSVSRRIIGEEAVRELWRLANLSAGIPGLSCPSCRRPARSVTLRVQASKNIVELDVCTRCSLLWFDGPELLVLADMYGGEPVGLEVRRKPREHRLSAPERLQVAEAVHRSRSRDALARQQTAQPGGFLQKFGLALAAR